MNRYILLFFHVLSLVLLGLGWVKDMLHIDISTHLFIDFNLFNEKRSVIGTLTSLWEGGNYWPFTLIFLFGIVVPVLKSVLIFFILFVPRSAARYYGWVSAISKWAMADVFAISIFVAFLGANAMENTKAVLEPGFYYFSAYVLISAILVGIMGKMMRKDGTSSL